VHACRAQGQQRPRQAQACLRLQAACAHPDPGAVWHWVGVAQLRMPVRVTQVKGMGGKDEVPSQEQGQVRGGKAQNATRRWRHQRPIACLTPLNSSRSAGLSRSSVSMEVLWLFLISTFVQHGQQTGM